MTSWNAVTWDTARAGGFVAYLLLTLAVVAGLVLRNRWQSARWPRLVTNEVHGYLSLLALVFVAVHVLAVAVDPFTHFGLRELLLPFVSHYRPLWMGLGIIGLYLLLAVWMSTRLRTRIGYRLWRRLHLLAFAVYAATTVHGLGAGSDTRTVWGLGIYAASVSVVAMLTIRRLLVPVGRDDRRRPLVAAATGLGLVGIAGWALGGPVAPHWGVRTGPAAAAVSSAARPPVAARASGAVRTPFVARFTGEATVGEMNAAGFVTVRIHGALRGGTADHLEILVHGVPFGNGGVEMRDSLVRLGRETALYTGRISELDGLHLVASVASSSERLQLDIRLQLTADGRARGTVRGTAAGAVA